VRQNDLAIPRIRSAIRNPWTRSIYRVMIPSLVIVGHAASTVFLGFIDSADPLRF
jgi:hypothetical protein